VKTLQTIVAQKKMLIIGLGKSIARTRQEGDSSWYLAFVMYGIWRVALNPSPHLPPTTATRNPPTQAHDPHAGGGSMENILTNKTNSTLEMSPPTPHGF